jgi:hypothetical protein
LWRGEGTRVASDDVDPTGDTPAQEGLRPIDAGIEKRDRDAAPILVRQSDVRPLSEARSRQETRAKRRRICRPHGIHTRHVRCPFEQRDPARVERGREAVDGSRVTELGLDDDALDAQPCDQKLLRRERALRPLPLLLTSRQASRGTDAVCEGGRLEQDDHALADRDARTLGPGKTLPTRFSLGCQAAAVTSGRDQDGRRDDRQSREHERVSRLTRWTRTHRAQDSGDTGWDP